MADRNHNRKLDISTAPTKARSREPAYSQALIQTKSIGSGSDPESQGRQPVRRLRWMPRQQKINEMNGAHLASPIRGELIGYAHWPQLGTQFIAQWRIQEFPKTR